MPSNYAHYRFGVSMLETMPGDIQRTVKRHRRLYDVGLHGPDIFFYYSPLFSTRIGALGSRFHHTSGADFFSRASRGLRFNPSEAGSAYLYGVLAHFCLDSLCHPYVASAATEPGDHLKIESEFDRFLLELDGKVPAHTQDLSPHIKLNNDECAVVSQFYPGCTPVNVRDCIRNMALATKAFSVSDASVRTVIEKGIGFFSKKHAGMLMPPAADEKYTCHNLPLLELYKQAQEKSYSLLLQLNAHLTYNAPLGEDFLLHFDV